MGPRIPPATSVRHTPRASTSSFSGNSASAPSFASSKTRTAPARHEDVDTVDRVDEPVQEEERGGLRECGG